MNDERIVDEILRREGWPKYTNRASDRGGPTKGGITLAAWREHMHDATLTEADLQAITEPQACAFYTVRHLQPFAEVNDPTVRELLVDCGVHHGTQTAAIWAQRVAAVPQDGRLGPISLAALNRLPAVAVLCRLVALRIRHFGRIVSQDPQLARAKVAGFNCQAENANGWNARAAEFLERVPM